MKSARHYFLLVLAALVGWTGLGAAGNSADPSLAPTPPMGWNSWDSYGPTVREDEVKANADYMAQNLAKFGWQYIIVDTEWYQPNAKSHGYIPRGAVTMRAPTCSLSV